MSNDITDYVNMRIRKLTDAYKKSVGQIEKRKGLGAKLKVLKEVRYFLITHRQTQDFDNNSIANIDNQ